MTPDIRVDSSRYYDLAATRPDDIPFYIDRLPHNHARVLELGCGTGRVLLPLAPRCAFIRGIDLSPAMLAVCQAKLEAAGLGHERARVEVGDVSRCELGETFELILAPYRVMQNLDTDEEVAGFLAGIHRHLAPGGSAIVTAFNPSTGPDELVRRRSSPEETLVWSRPLEVHELRCYESIHRLPVREGERFAIYPRLIYRLFRAEDQIDEAVLDIAMRVYYPDALVETLERHGFRVLERWGGYAGQVYGVGPELVVRFGAQ